MKPSPPLLLAVLGLAAPVWLAGCGSCNDSKGSGAAPSASAPVPTARPVADLPSSKAPVEMTLASTRATATETELTATIASNVSDLQATLKVFLPSGATLASGAAEEKIALPPKGSSITKTFKITHPAALTTADPVRVTLSARSASSGFNAEQVFPTAGK